MRGRGRWLGWIAALCVVGGLGASASAQLDPPDERYVGHYRYDGTMADGRERVTAAFAPILNRLDPLVAASARAQLRESEPVPRGIDVWIRGRRVFVRYTGADEQRTFESRVGHPEEIESRWGGGARMTQLFRGGNLEQIFETERGRWYNVFRLDETGQRLDLRVVLTSDRLAQPIQLELPYVRVPAP